MLDRVLRPEGSFAVEARIFTRTDDQAVDWAVSAQPVGYEAAVAVMEARARAIYEGTACEMVWLLEHPALYTAGVSSKGEDLLVPDRFPVHASGRGGQYTYHGPGQRVAYIMLDLRARGRDVHAFVQALEVWIINALATFNVQGEVKPCRVGVWVTRKVPGLRPQEDKIAALGVKLRHWVSFHGISLNVEPDLSHFDAIVPCGISEHGVTSLVDLGLPVTMQEADQALLESFKAIFGACRAVEPPI
jgi:lipoyl(octanoyl) transferase